MAIVKQDPVVQVLDDVLWLLSEEAKGYTWMQHDGIEWEMDSSPVSQLIGRAYAIYPSHGSLDDLNQWAEVWFDEEGDTYAARQDFRGAFCGGCLVGTIMYSAWTIGLDNPRDASIMAECMVDDITRRICRKDWIQEDGEIMYGAQNIGSPYFCSDSIDFNDDDVATVDLVRHITRIARDAYIMRSRIAEQSGGRYDPRRQAPPFQPGQGEFDNANRYC